MYIDDNVKQQIWDTILDEYKVRNINIVLGELEVKERTMAADVVKELKEAYCELHGIKDSDNISQLVKKSFDIDDIAEEAVKLALNRKRVCVVAKKIYQIKGIGKRAEQYCSYKNNFEFVSSGHDGVTEVIHFGGGGKIDLIQFSEDCFIGREFHNAFIYMQGVDIDDYFYNTYEKIVQRCRMK